MITREHRNYIKNNNENLFNEILQYEQGKSFSGNVTLLKSKKEDYTLKLKVENKEVFIHSNYNPQREAEMFASQYLDLGSYEHVLFVGTGLGYHIKLILEANPHLKVSIYEPNSEILYHYLNSTNAAKIKVAKLNSIFSNIHQLKDRNYFLNQYAVNTLTIFWNVTKQLYANEIEEFEKYLVSFMKYKLNNMSINYKFEQRWTLNALGNFSKVLQSPNILLDINKDSFENKPIILVAAGPSLSYEWGNLKYIKEKGLAYIFAVGSAINALIEHDIKPDAFFTYDPSELNNTVIAKMKERNISDIPVVFGSTVAAGVIENLENPLVHFVTTQDKITPMIIKDPNFPVVRDASSISIMAYQIIAALKASHIIVVGQNFGFVDNKTYADGINYSYNDGNIREKEIKDLIEIEDVEGNKMYTLEIYQRMLKDFEACIEMFNHLPIINTTKKGAKIKGAPFMPLEKVIVDILTEENKVIPNWYLYENQYNIQTIKKQKNVLDEEAIKMEKYLKTSIADINRINDLYKKRVLTNIEEQLDIFDKTLFKIYDNEFFKKIILPTMRNQKDQFSQRTVDVKVEKNLIKKVELFNLIFVKFIEAVYARFMFIKPNYMKFTEEKITEKESL